MSDRRETQTQKCTVRVEKHVDTGLREEEYSHNRYNLILLGTTGVKLS